MEFVFLVIFPTYWVMQAWMAVRYRKPWRLWALAPLCITLPLAVLAFNNLGSIDGGNLWAGLLIGASPIGFIYLSLLAAARKWFTSARME